jgi:hypothetical protein
MNIVVDKLKKSKHWANNAKVNSIDESREPITGIKACMATIENNRLVDERFIDSGASTHVIGVNNFSFKIKDVALGL